MGGSACLWARERPAAARRPNVWRSRTLPEGGFTPHEDVEETGSPEAWNTRFREKSGTKTRNCPSGPWRPWDSWIWSERAAPLAFGRVSAPPPCGVQASGGARPLGRGVSPPRRRVSFPAMGKKPKDRRGRLTSPSGTGSLRLQFVLPRTPIYGGYPYTLM